MEAHSSSDRLGDTWLDGTPSYVTDLSRCTPQSALSDRAAARRWRMLPYETDTLAGVMLRADPETAAHPVTCPLTARGWHAVSVGLYAVHAGEQVIMLVRLSGEETFTKLAVFEARREEQGHITELFWRIADLTGHDLVLAQLLRRTTPGDAAGAMSCPRARIAYVKLVPLSAEEVRIVQRERAERGTRRLYAVNDAHGLHANCRAATPEAIRRELEPFRDTDFGRIYWECGMGDLLYFPGSAGRIPTFDGLTDFHSANARYHCECWRIFREQGLDPFRIARDYAREIGMEFHASYRVAGFKFPSDHDHFDHGDSFYDRHPELRGTARSGETTPRLSYAYAETRRFAVDLLREVASTYDVDGVSLAYNRRPPLVEYEPPVVDGFRAEIGLDPFELDPADRRWLAYRARVLTGFMQEVRAAMDSLAQEQGRRRIAVSAIVMASEQENLQMGMDLPAWIEQGLVDTIIPYTSAPALDSTQDSWADPHDGAWFIAITKGTACEAAFNLLPRRMSAETYRRRAAGLYGIGAERFAFWDCTPELRADGSSAWSALRRLGHRDEVLAWAAAGEPELGVGLVPVRKLAGWDLSYATPG